MANNDNMLTSFQEVDDEVTFEEFKRYADQVREYFDLIVTKAQYFSALLLPEEASQVPAVPNRTFGNIYTDSKADDIIFHEKSSFKWMEKHLKDSKTWVEGQQGSESLMRFKIRQYFRVAFVAMQSGQIPYDIIADKKRRREYVDQIVSCGNKDVYYNIFKSN